MAPATPPDIIVSDDLSNLHIDHPVSTMHHDTSNSINQHTESNRVKLTLETLPPEIKNEILSQFLLAAKVKYSTNGSWPGNKYKFDTTIMRVNKQMKQDATAYLHSQNEFALISSKFFAFEVDKRRFLPNVATGKAARTFKSPAIEATITHVETTICVCCNPRKHNSKDRVTHALFLVADLEHLVRELRLTFHIWPSKPIYIISKSDESPVQHIPVNVDTQVKIVWKVNPSHRQDLNVAECRARQTRLLAPLDFPTGSGKQISVIGVDKDISRKVTEKHTPRILSIDAVGWDLHNLLKAQKGHLDNVLSQDPPSLSRLIDSYTDLACVGWPLGARLHLRNASVVRNVNMHGTMISLCLTPFEDLDDEEHAAALTDSWQVSILSLVLDCMFTVLRLGLEDESFGGMRDVLALISRLYMHTFRSGQRSLLPRRFTVLLGHYMTWLSCIETTDPEDEDKSAFLQTRDELDHFMGMVRLDDEDDVWQAINQDREFLNRVVAGEVQPWNFNFGCFEEPCVNFQGLLNRPRIHNSRIHTKPPCESYQGWTTKREFPKPEIAAHITKFSDDIVKLKFEERSPELAEDALDHGHVAFAVLNFPREPEPEAEGPELPPGMLPPGMPHGILPPGILPANILTAGIIHL